MHEAVRQNLERWVCLCVPQLALVFTAGIIAVTSLVALVEEVAFQPQLYDRVRCKCDVTSPSQTPLIFAVDNYYRIRPENSVSEVCDVMPKMSWEMSG